MTDQTARDRAALRERIAKALIITSREDWPYTPGQEKWDHHKHGDRPGHTYAISCALCTNDVDRLTEAVLAVLPEPTDPAAVLTQAADRLAELRAAEREWLPATGLHKGEEELRRLADDAQPASPAPLAQGLPLVKGNCPACHATSLFLGNGGYVTCSRIDCPEPDAASTVLERPAAAARPDDTKDA